MEIKMNNPQAEAIELLISKVAALGDSLSASDLDWAIRMEDAYKSCGTLSLKQLVVLINILAKYDGKED